jgi:hypothetical protein
VAADRQARQGNIGCRNSELYGRTVSNSSRQQTSMFADLFASPPKPFDNFPTQLQRERRLRPAVRPGYGVARTVWTHLIVFGEERIPWGSGAEITRSDDSVLTSSTSEIGGDSEIASLVRTDPGGAEPTPPVLHQPFPSIPSAHRAYRWLEKHAQFIVLRDAVS